MSSRAEPGLLGMSSLRISEQLRGRVVGAVLTPADASYEVARRVWNAMVDRRPGVIVRCAGVDDVVTAVRTARDNGIEIGVRCGGHSVIGHAVPDGGLMIDLTPMGAAWVDPERRIAVVQGGALLGALDVASQQYGMATTAGNVSHTGVGGLTLGGGMGWLAREHGLTCDNVRSLELVTAEGAVVRASAEENTELFWGLRGGGGNFGIVTRFEFDLHPLQGSMLTAEVDVPLDDAAPVVRAWRDFSLAAPRRLTGLAVIADGIVTVGFVWVGGVGAGQPYASQLRTLAGDAAVAERITSPSYVELQRREDTIEGHAIRRYWKGHYFRVLDDQVIDRLLDGVRAPYSPAASLQAYGGAIAEVADEDTAFSQRDARFELVCAARWTDPAEDDLHIAEARSYAAAVESFASGAYVNVLGDEGEGGVWRAYGRQKLTRLTALKDKYDPDNAFHLNQNIPPSKVSRRTAW
jgi:FAD/FMN-containing dehydrogenase